MYMLVLWEKHTHMITSKWFRFIIAKIYNILRYVIPHILRHTCMCIKETKISQKRSKGIKNWKITYAVILSVLSSKTNLILGFSSPWNTVERKVVQVMSTLYSWLTNRPHFRARSLEFIITRMMCWKCDWKSSQWCGNLHVHVYVHGW